MLCALPHPFKSLLGSNIIILLQIAHPSIREDSFLDGDSVPVGPLGLYIKAVVLLGRVINYLQRSYSHGIWKPIILTCALWKRSASVPGHAGRRDVCLNPGEAQGDVSDSLTRLFGTESLISRYAADPSS